MPLMVSPDGKERVEVPDGDVAHYRSIGAKLVNYGSGAGPQFSGGYTGAPDDALIPEYPIENAQALLGGVQLARAAPGLIRAVPGLVRGAGSRLAGLVKPLGRATIGPERTAAAGDLAQGVARLGQTRLDTQPLGASIARLETTAAPAPALEGAGQRLASAQLSQALPEAVPAAPTPAPAPLPPLERIKAMRTRKNASAESRQADGIELELAMEEAKLSAQARKALRQRLGHEAPKAASTPRATPAPKATEAPEIKAVKGGRPDDPLPQNDPSALKPEPLGPRHGVQKWSKSKKQHLTIENMNVPHLRASINEYGRDLAKLGKNARERAPVKAAVLDAMRAEIKHRGETSGVHGF